MAWNPGGSAHDAIAVTHPHVQQPMAFGADTILDVAQQRRVAARPDFGVAEFAHLARHHLAAQLRRHGVHAVANAEHRHAQLIDGARRGGRPLHGHGLRSPGKDHAARAKGAHGRIAHVPGMDLAVHAQFAHAPRDQLRVLRTEVDDQHALGVYVRLAGSRLAATQETR